jgi:hypothetical protein
MTSNLRVPGSIVGRDSLSRACSLDRLRYIVGAVTLDRTVLSYNLLLVLERIIIVRKNDANPAISESHSEIAAGLVWPLAALFNVFDDVPCLFAE